MITDHVCNFLAFYCHPTGDVRHDLCNVCRNALPFGGHGGGAERRKSVISHDFTWSHYGTCMTICSTSKLEWCLTRAWLRSFSADKHLKMTLKVDTKSRHWSCRFNFSGLWIYHSPPSMFSWIWAMLCESHTPIWLQAYDLQYETRSHTSMTHCCKML